MKTTSKSTLKNEVETVTDLQSTSTETKTESLSTSVSDNTTTRDEIDEYITITRWSEPDSTGKQHPTETTNISRQKHSDKKNDIIAESTKTSDGNTTVSIIDNSKTTEKKDVTTAEKTSVKVSTPSWVIAIIAGIFIVILIVILIVIFAVLKRYRII